MLWIQVRLYILATVNIWTLKPETWHVPRSNAVHLCDLITLESKDTNSGNRWEMCGEHWMCKPEAGNLSPGADTWLFEGSPTHAFAPTVDRSYETRKWGLMYWELNSSIWAVLRMIPRHVHMQCVKLLSKWNLFVWLFLTSDRILQCLVEWNCFVFLCAEQPDTKRLNGQPVSVRNQLFVFSTPQ